MGRSDSQKKFSGVARGDEKGSLCCCKGQEAQLLEGLCARPFITVIYQGALVALRKWLQRGRSRKCEVCA